MLCKITARRYNDMASDGLWKLFAKTGDIRLYLLYREETAKELVPDADRKKSEGKSEEKLLPGDIPRG